MAVRRTGPTNNYLNFERPVYELDQKIRELEALSERNKLDFTEQIRSFRGRRDQILREIFSGLTPWQRVLLARHSDRPQMRDYVELTFSDFVELSGDRLFGDDKAIVTGFARVDGRSVMLVGQHKGRNVRERHAANAGSPHPEGFRKALAKMRLAEKFGLPVVSLIDTKGAFPGTGAEERGQAGAIAVNLAEMSVLRTPVVCVVIGEGGSGGALGIGVGDRTLMLEHAYYSVISPEGGAAILWKDGSKAPEAAAALKCTADDLAEIDLVDEIVPEPLGGAHRDPAEMGRLLREALARALDALAREPLDALLERRYEKIRRIGVWREAADAK